MPSLFSAAKQCKAIKNVINNHIVSLYNDMHVTEYNDQVINGTVNYTDFHLVTIIFWNKILEGTRLGFVGCKPRKW